MRVAAIYDIHANLPALEAALGEIREATVDLVLVGGDIVPGPMPRETLDLLLGLDVPTHFLRGNCETAMLAHMSGTSGRTLPREAVEAIEWSAMQLDRADANIFESWPRTLRLPIDGLGDILFCHGTARDEDECFTRRTSEARVAPMFAGVDAALVVCGHTHMQFDRVANGLRIVNAGSIGMPFGEPGADWVLLGPAVELRHTPYDLQAAADRIRRTSYPNAADFAERYVLRPPSEAMMLDVFARAESKLEE